MAGSESESSRSRGNIDMLSSLPDSVLHHIMSFMPACQAVQLCVLSKRWKTLWTTLPVLNFGFRFPQKKKKNFGFRELGNDWLNHSVHNRVKRLAEFVSTVLLLREATSQLHTFTLDFGPRKTLSLMSIRPWILYAIKCNLRVLTISWMGKTILLPSEVFTCPSLEYFNLTTKGCIGTPEIINLPSLKQLYLKSSELDQDFMSKLLSGCPLLEDLLVEGCSVEICKLTSHSLKHLKIMANCPLDWIELSEMIINSPNLLSFHFDMCSCCQEKGVILNTPSLHEACIKFSTCTCEPDLTKSNILCGLINVNRLVLKGNWTLACLEADIANCRTFTKLTCLSVSDLCLSIVEFNLLSSLLEHCPNLKKLTVCPNDCGSKCWNEQKKVARFKCELLETVEVKFGVKGRACHLVVKCLQEAVAELPNCQIIMTSA